MGGTQLHADAGLALGHHGIIETRYEDPLFGHLGGEFLGQGSVVEHNCADGALGGLDVEAGGHHLVPEVVHVLYQLVVQGVALFEDLEGFQGGAGNHRRNGVGEQVRTGALAEHVNDFLAAGGETAHGAAKGLAQGAGEDIYAAVAVKLFRYAMTGAAHHAGAVALVHHHQGVVFFGQVTDLVHRGHVAVHGEYAVRDDDAETAGLGFLELFFQILHIGIVVAETLGLAQAHTVNDGSVVEGVRDNGVLGCEKGLEHTAVGVEAGGVQDGVFRVEIVCNGLFQLFVDILGAADEADGGHSVTAGVHRFLGGFDEAGVIGQAQIVVGAEVEGLAAVLQLDAGALGRCDISFSLVKAGLVDGLELGTQMLLKFSVHS